MGEALGSLYFLIFMPPIRPAGWIHLTQWIEHGLVCQGIYLVISGLWLGYCDPEKVI